MGRPIQFHANTVPLSQTQPTNGRHQATNANLLRKLAIARSDQVRALDTTYVPMARGLVYLTAVVDVASRRVLALTP